MNLRRSLALVLAAVLGLAACGGATDDDGASDGRRNAGVVIEDGFATAAASTLDAGSARMLMTMNVAVPGAGDVTLEAEGITDFVTGNSAMSMNMGELMQGLGGDDFTIEVRTVDGVMYLRYPEMMTQMLGGTTWLSIDAGAAMTEGNQGTTAPFGQSDPTQWLEQLGVVSSGVEEVGREPVRDVETTRYRAVIDLTKAVDQVPAETLEALGIDADEFAEQLEQMRAVAGSELPVEVWIDDDDLMRRMTLTMAVDGQEAVVDFELYDYGVEVGVEAPPADEVGDLQSMLGGLGGGFGMGQAAA